MPRQRPGGLRRSTEGGIRRSTSCGEHGQCVSGGLIISDITSPHRPPGYGAPDHRPVYHKKPPGAADRACSSTGRAAADFKLMG
jgi:hypothetical protein